MSHSRGRSLQVWTPLLFSIVMVTGMTLGYRLHDTLRPKRDLRSTLQRDDRLQEIIDLVSARYVDTVNTGKLYDDAVKGILTHLDPHTVYIPSNQVEGVNQDLEGVFYGIGIEFAIIRDTLRITSVLEDGPAADAGLATGDQVIAVGKTVIAGVGLSSEKIVSLLKGKRKSSVDISIRSIADGTIRATRIVRDEVPLYSVDAALLLEPGIGYIRMNRFSATTYDEFSDAVGDMKREGMQSLIVDLRGNGGGYLDVAVSIADDFLDGDKLIVYTKGEHSQRREYRSENSGLFEQGKLVILVDESSASASEILAGAVQDWDRGIIIGRRSFGKGLVQEQYDLSDGAALRLTIARYFTPSGRSIQRPFDKGRDAYETDFRRRFENGELTGADSLGSFDETRAYYTAAHRMVRGGGGIKPDFYVPYDTIEAVIASGTLSASEELQATIWQYYARNARTLSRYRTVDAFRTGFHEETAILNSYLQAGGGKYAVLRDSKVRVAVLTSIKATIARILFGGEGYFGVSAGTDAVVQKAMEVLKGPEYSTAISR